MNSIKSSVLNSLQWGWSFIPSPLRRFTKFCLVGGSGVFINLATFYLVLHVLGLVRWGHTGVMLSGLTGFIFSVFTNFILNDLWTWSDRPKGGRRHFWGRLLKYFVASTAGGAVQLGTLSLLTQYLGLNPLLGQFIGIMLGTALNFVASHFWAFKEVSPKEKPAMDKGV